MGHQLTMSSISDVFTQCVEDQSGSVTDTFNDGSRLFIRSLLPQVKEVRPDDRMQGGIALRATESDICVHPYLFREVCRNGAIMAHAIESWKIDYSEFTPADEVLESLEQAILVCSDPLVFSSQIGDIRTEGHSAVDIAITMLPMLSEFPQSVVREVYARCFDAANPTRFSLMNAVTSVARDTRDPERKWRLEELGGAIGAALLPFMPDDSRGLHLDPRGTMVES